MVAFWVGIGVVLEAVPWLSSGAWNLLAAGCIACVSLLQAESDFPGLSIAPTIFLLIFLLACIPHLVMSALDLCHAGAATAPPRVAMVRATCALIGLALMGWAARVGFHIVG